MESKMKFPEIPLEVIKAVEASAPGNPNEWTAYAIKTMTVLFEKWNLEPIEILVGGALSICVLCKHSDDLTVLKTPFETESGRREVNILKNINCGRFPEVIYSDHNSGSFLMEYIENSKEKYTLKEVCELCADINKSLENPINKGIKSIKENIDLRKSWASERFSDPKYLKEKNQFLLADKLLNIILQEESKETYFLHGDLQSKNLINTGKMLRCLDPMAGFGPLYFDIAFYIALTSEGEDMEVYVKEASEILSFDEGKLLYFTWALAAIENRPYQKSGAQRRQRFIDRYENIIIEYLNCKNVKTTD